MRATLHEELMREAGFETEYDEAASRRRERRRRRALAAGLLVLRILLALAGVAALVEAVGLVDFMPRYLVAAVWILIAVGATMELAGGVGAALLAHLGWINRPERDSKDKQRERRERAELLASFAAPGQPLESVKVAEREEEPRRRGLSRRELLLLPLPVAIAGVVLGVVLALSAWWLLLGVLLLGIAGVVCLVAYVFAAGIDEALRSS